MFDVFDANSTHGRVYRALVSQPHVSAGALAVATGLPETTVRKALTELRDADMAVPLDTDDKDLWEPERPDVVAANALRYNEDWRFRLLQAESDLMEMFHFARRQNSGLGDVEVLEGAQATFARFRTIQESVREQVRAIDRPPYYWDDAEITRQETLQCGQMAAGINYRTIYQESASDSPARNAAMMRTIASGENARVLTDPPIKLTVVDDQVAILAADPPPGAEGTLVALLVFPSILLTSLISVFETLWRLAVPVNLAALNQTITERERDILTLMASGATDDAIARRLGLSRRTVVRQVAKLLEQLGATTRFQAGAQAARRGWL